MSILRADRLIKHYRRRKVVSDVSLNVASGEIVGLLGPNGAGKTTCFYMIAGLIPASRGEIFLDDHNITHLPMPARARLGLGYLPQDASVFRKLTVSENILAILQTRKTLDKKQRLERLQNLLDE
ncbi:MAG: lipopolysaccharide export system ATP-binding protein, partial [Pseudomonadota bacterium]|nr:lipopolysaccharide export system ATP-binding protein [Pseudomonadota bacterium]